MAPHPLSLPLFMFGFFWNTASNATQICIALEAVWVTFDCVISFLIVSKLKASFEWLLIFSFLRIKESKGRPCELYIFKTEKYKTEGKSWPLLIGIDISTYLDISWLYTYVSDLLLPLFLHILQPFSWAPGEWSAQYRLNIVQNRSHHDYLFTLYGSFSLHSLSHLCN